MDGNTANNVVGDVGNDVVSGGVVDGVGGNVAGASDGGKKRLGNGPLIAILVVLLVVIVGLGVGVGILANQKADEYSEEDLGSLVMEYLYDSDSDINGEVLASELQNIFDNSDDMDKVVQSALDLSVLYSGISGKDAVAPLEDALKKDLNNQQKYRVLVQLLSTYNEGSNEYRNALCRISKLPDDMILEFEDWSMVKPMLVSELEAVGGCRDGV